VPILRTSKPDIKNTSFYYHRIIVLFKATILVIAVNMLYYSTLHGQDKTQYLLHEIPQTISLNPAVYYECKKYIELPILSQIQFYYRNNGFSYNQAFEGGTGTSMDSVRLDIDGLSDALVNRNHLRLGEKVNLLGFGFAYQGGFYSFNISNRSAFRISFNRDLIDARDGNWDINSNLPREININGSGIHFINFTEVAFGASYSLYPGFSVGIRPKYLIGSAHLQTRRSDISLVTSQSPITLTGFSDFLIRGSLPITLIENSDGLVTDVESNLNSLADLPAFLFTWNHGFAIDAGVIYEYSRRLTLSASIVDLGFVRWRKNTSAILQQEDFIFEGVDLNNYLQTGTDIDIIQALRDSISNNFRLTGSEESYTAMIPFRSFAAVDYEWSEAIHLGAIVEAEVLSGRLYPSLTLTAISRPTDWLTASLSYSIMDRGFTNFGFGLAMGNRNLQLYFVTDNIPLNYVRELESGVLWPYRARTMNARIGLNVTFGCRDERYPRTGSKGILQKYYRSMKWRKSCPTYD
jgi:hypothetical protein